MKTTKRMLVILIASFALIIPVTVFAQDEVPVTNPNIIAGLNVLMGFVISFIVHWLKGIAIVNHNPKKAAAVLSLIGSVLAGYLGTKVGIGVWPVILGFITQLATSIGTFETVIKATGSSDS